MVRMRVSKAHHNTLVPTTVRIGAGQERLGDVIRCRISILLGAVWCLHVLEGWVRVGATVSVPLA